MTRIIAGSASSLKLQVPTTGTRPTSDRAREAIFSTLDAWDFIINTRVLDLYAGSGALALEALSRGAKNAVLVEKHPPAARCITANAQTVLRAINNDPTRLQTPTSYEVITADVNVWLAQAADKHELFDVAFVDPPYNLPDEHLAQNLTALTALLEPHAAVLVERDKRSPEPAWPQTLRRIKQKNYGETTCWWAEVIQ